MTGNSDDSLARNLRNVAIISRIFYLKSFSKETELMLKKYTIFRIAHCSMITVSAFHLNT